MDDDQMLALLGLDRATFATMGESFAEIVQRRRRDQNAKLRLIGASLAWLINDRLRASAASGHEDDENGYALAAALDRWLVEDVVALPATEPPIPAKGEAVSLTHEQWRKVNGWPATALCPKCNAYDVLPDNGNKFTCPGCGAEWWEKPISLKSLTDPTSTDLPHVGGVVVRPAPVMVEVKPMMPNEPWHPVEPLLKARVDEATVINRTDWRGIFGTPGPVIHKTAGVGISTVNAAASPSPPAADSRSGGLLRPYEAGDVRVDGCYHPREVFTGEVWESVGGEDDGKARITELMKLSGRTAVSVFPYCPPPPLAPKLPSNPNSPQPDLDSSCGE